MSHHTPHNTSYHTHTPHITPKHNIFHNNKPAYQITSNTSHHTCTHITPYHNKPHITPHLTPHNTAVTHTIGHTTHQITSATLTHHKNTKHEITQYDMKNFVCFSAQKIVISCKFILLYYRSFINFIRPKVTFLHFSHCSLNLLSVRRQANFLSHKFNSCLCKLSQICLICVVNTAYYTL